MPLSSLPRGSRVNNKHDFVIFTGLARTAGKAFSVGYVYFIKCQPKCIVTNEDQSNAPLPLNYP